MSLTVNGERLIADLRRLAEFGGQADGSVNRPAFSDADVQARRWFADLARDAGLDVATDGLLNVTARTPGGGSGPAVWTGSHLDTVPDGGMFDGALGAMAGLECVRRLHEAGLDLAHPVVSVAFSDEEGAYLGFLGSKGLAHGLRPAEFARVRGIDGRTVVQAISDAGGDPDARDVRLSPGAVSHFLELHIEQGPRLEAEGVEIGVVTGIVGIHRAQVRFGGRPDHAGTTPMHLRRDALRGVGALLERLPELPAQSGAPEAVVTCGRITIQPGADNVVPESAVMYLDIRAASTADIERLETTIARAAHACGARHGLDSAFDRQSTTAPVDMYPAMTDLIAASADSLGLTSIRMPSGAGHDSQVMADIAPTGMIFVPSEDGRSHSRLEYTGEENVIHGANVLLATLVHLATDSLPADDRAEAVRVGGAR